MGVGNLSWTQLGYSFACVHWTLTYLWSGAASSLGDTTSRSLLAIIWGYRDNWGMSLIIQSGGSRLTRLAIVWAPMHKHFSSFCLHYFHQCPIDQSKLKDIFKRKNKQVTSWQICSISAKLWIQGEGAFVVIFILPQAPILFPLLFWSPSLLQTYHSISFFFIQFLYKKHCSFSSRRYTPSLVMRERKMVKVKPKLFSHFPNAF